LGQPLLEAIATPRIHHQWKPDAVFYEDSVPQTELDYLKALGHPLSVLKFEGSTTAVVKTSDGFVAVSEPRLDARNSPKANPTGGAFSSSEQ